MQRVWTSCFWLGLVVATALFLAPLPEIAEAPQFSDKAIHAALFGLLCGAGIFAAYVRKIVIFGLIGYGATIELIQGVLPFRSASLADLAADVIGVVVVAAITLVRVRNT